MSEYTSTFRDVYQLILSGVHAANSKSITENAKNTMIEPITLIDKRVEMSENSDAILREVLNVISAYYVSSVTTMGTVGDLVVTDVLDRINPNREPLISARSGPSNLNKWLSHESEDDYHGAGLGSSKNVDSFNESSSLCVGNTYAVKVESNGMSREIGLTVRLRSIIGSPANVISAMSVGKNKKDFTEAYYDLKAGQMSFLRDLILGRQDILEHRKNLKDDTTGMYRSNLKRNNKNAISAILSLTPSVSNASNIYVISEETATELNRVIRGDIKKFKIREKLFEDTYGTLLVVVSDSDNVVTFYTRGSEYSWTVSMRALMRTSKNAANVDMMDLLNNVRGGAL